MWLVYKGSRWRKPKNENTFYLEFHFKNYKVYTRKGKVVGKVSGSATNRISNFLTSIKIALKRQQHHKKKHRGEGGKRSGGSGDGGWGETLT